MSSTLQQSRNIYFKQKWDTIVIEMLRKEVAKNPNVGGDLAKGLDFYFQAAMKFAAQLEQEFKMGHSEVPILIDTPHMQSSLLSAAKSVPQPVPVLASKMQISKTPEERNSVEISEEFKASISANSNPFKTATYHVAVRENTHNFKKESTKPQSEQPIEDTKKVAINILTKHPENAFPVTTPKTTAENLTIDHIPAASNCEPPGKEIIQFVHPITESSKVEPQSLKPLRQKESVGAICMDGWISAGSGPQTCFHHGGVREWLYKEISDL